MGGSSIFGSSISEATLHDALIAEFRHCCIVAFWHATCYAALHGGCCTAGCMLHCVLASRPIDGNVGGRNLRRVRLRCPVPTSQASGIASRPPPCTPFFFLVGACRRRTPRGSGEARGRHRKRLGAIAARGAFLPSTGNPLGIRRRHPPRDSCAKKKRKEKGTRSGAWRPASLEHRHLWLEPTTTIWSLYSAIFM